MAAAEAKGADFVQRKKPKQRRKPAFEYAQLSDFGPPTSKFRRASGFSDRRPRPVPTGLGLRSGPRRRPYAPVCAEIPGDSRGPPSARPSPHPFPKRLSSLVSTKDVSRPPCATLRKLCVLLSLLHAFRALCARFIHVRCGCGQSWRYTKY